MTSAQLGVDSENANEALTLYRRHGFEVQRRRPSGTGAEG